MLIFSTGERFGVEIHLEAGAFVARVGERVVQIPLHVAEINLMYRFADSREFPSVQSGSTLALNTGPTDQLIISYRNQLVGTGQLVEVEGQLGVQLTSTGTPRVHRE